MSSARVILDVLETIRIIKSDGKRVKLSTNFNQERNQIDLIGIFTRMLDDWSVSYLWDRGIWVFSLI